MKEKPRNRILFTYVIDHSGDPSFVDGNLVLGVQNCKKKMRPSVRIGDWIIATLGGRYPWGSRMDRTHRPLKANLPDAERADYYKYLVYAMEVTDKQKPGDFLMSNKTYDFSGDLKKMPDDFCKKTDNRLSFAMKNENHQTIKDEEEIKHFLDWLKTQTTCESNQSLLDKIRTNEKKCSCKCK